LMVYGYHHVAMPIIEKKKIKIKKIKSEVKVFPPHFNFGFLLLEGL